MKTNEYRHRPARIIGERFWIYAAKGAGTKALTLGGTEARRHGGTKGIWSRDIGAPTEPLPPWMVELAEGLRLWKPGELPTGVIVGSAMIERCEAVPPVTAEGSTDLVDVAPRPAVWRWHLADVLRSGELRKPTRHPQPAWFQPF